MAQLSLTNLLPTGTPSAYQSAGSGGDTFNNPTDERAFVHVKNGSGSSITVTIAPARTTTVKVAGFGLLTAPTRAIAIAGGADAMIGPFPPAYNDANNNITLTYSATTSVTIGAFRLSAQSF